MVSVVLPPRDVTSSVKYLVPGSKNERYFSKGIEVNIGEYEDVSVVVRDARPHRDECTLETSGFTLADHKSKISNFYDRSQLDHDYIAEMVDLIKSLSGADEVVIFSPPVLRQNKDEPGSAYQPRAVDVHTDFSPANAEWAARNRTDKIGDYTRFAFINVWRSITPPPQDWPLALVDARSVGQDEGVPYPMIMVDKIPEKLPLVPTPPTPIEGCNFVYKEAHEWRYFSNMTRDEVLVFKLYDSDNKKGSKSWRCPHTAVFDSTDGTIPRESVEVRAICFFK